MTTMDGWNFDQPTEAEMLKALADALGGPEYARAVLDTVCRKIGQSRPVTSPGDMIRVAEALLEFADMLRVTARSVKIRAVTYRALEGVLPPR
ncbi:hypothetical protein [Actinoplanes sp. NPDC049802]|uniref:hypothetical protein n=1 Tax=Actinoplanes sp. NPDC049802 TaxID=3154742 RepID=UPI0033CE5A26